MLDVATITTPRCEQLLEQPAQDHRVGDVRHLEFVEAEKRRFVGDRMRHGRNGIVARLAHEFGTLGAYFRIEIAPFVDARVHLLMKALKCTRRFFAMGALSKNMSISMDLPRPTSPQMIKPARGFGAAEQRPPAGL